MITIRSATPADQETIVRIIREVQINPMDLKWANFLVAVDDESGAIVGTGQIKKHGDGSEELASIATLPEYRGRGIAHQIIEQLLVRHPGLLYLTCMDNMERLYQQFGFRTIGPGEMTPYFRRITRLAKGFMLLDRSGRKLLVMKREGDPAG
jgi:N-acetylglutamate synthase-like GNAT family acetyltransferase